MGCLRHVAFSTKRDFDGALRTDSPLVPKCFRADRSLMARILPPPSPASKGAASCGELARAHAHAHSAPIMKA
jgi:hypothetical protein